jgi:hypothetical protein
MILQNVQMDFQSAQSTCNFWSQLIRWINWADEGEQRCIFKRSTMFAREIWNRSRETLTSSNSCHGYLQMNKVQRHLHPKWWRNDEAGRRYHITRGLIRHTDGVDSSISDRASKKFPTWAVAHGYQERNGSRWRQKIEAMIFFFTFIFYERISVRSQQYLLVQAGSWK